MFLILVIGSFAAMVTFLLELRQNPRKVKHKKGKPSSLIHKIRGSLQLVQKAISESGEDSKDWENLTLKEMINRLEKSDDI